MISIKQNSNLSIKKKKVGASKKKLEVYQQEGPIDYIIIGTGLGGLTTASLLCKVSWLFYTTCL
jgi:hypothetical protein